MARAAGTAIHSARFYEVHDVIATGGMATVHLGRVVGDAGFGRVVAVKRLHPQFVGDPEFASMFVDEARLASRILHANVPPMLDVVAEGRELLLIMEYVHGESLARLLTESRAAKAPVPPAIAVSILSDVLHGLHAAHEATSPDGAPLHLVHRDVSPQNVLVGTDGIGRIVDFGVAKALGRSQMTRDGAVKGKLAYMAPEQLSGRSLDRRADVYSAGVVLWETLTGTRLFQGDSEGELLGKVLEAVVVPPSRLDSNVPTSLDEVTMRALARNPEVRYATADEMARALEATGARASASSVAAWVKERGGDALRGRAALLARMESDANAGARPLPAGRVSIADVATERVRFVQPALPLAEAGVAPSEVRPVRSAKRRAWPIASALLALAAMTAIALATWFAVRAPSDTSRSLAISDAAIAPAFPSESAALATPSSAPSAMPTLDSPAPVTSTALAESPSSSSSSPPPPRARPAPPRAAPSVAPKWCKVFDPTKRIFVVKPMNVARCP
jgi:hypothetical protein